MKQLPIRLFKYREHLINNKPLHRKWMLELEKLRKANSLLLNGYTLQQASKILGKEYNLGQARCYRILQESNLLFGSITYVKGVAMSGKIRKVYLDDEDNRIKEVVYIIETELGYKIGISKRFNSRKGSLGTLIPIEFKVVRLYQTKNYREIERVLHDMFAHVRIKGEWFNLSPKDLQYIDDYIESLNKTLPKAS